MYESNVFQSALSSWCAQESCFERQKHTYMIRWITVSVSEMLVWSSL